MITTTTTTTTTAEAYPQDRNDFMTSLHHDGNNNPDMDAMLWTTAFLTADPHPHPLLRASSTPGRL